MSNPTLRIRWLEPSEQVTGHFVAPAIGNITVTETLEAVVRRASDLLDSAGLDLEMAIDTEDGFILEPWILVLAFCKPIGSGKIALEPNGRMVGVEATIAWTGDCKAVDWWNGTESAS